MTRGEIIERFEAKVAAGRILVGVGPGSDIEAWREQAGSGGAGSADMIVIGNADRFRAAGHAALSGTLCYGDANRIVMQTGMAMLSGIERMPVLAGVCGTDPFRVMGIHLRQLQALGFSGVQNVPTVGLIDGLFRRNLEETGVGYDLEVEMIREAHGLGLLTCPYVFDPDQAGAMAEAGADVLVAHMGLVTQGPIGAETALTLGGCVGRIRAIIEAGRKVRPGVLTLCHGGPITGLQDARYLIGQVKGLDGFFSTSGFSTSGKRPPTANRRPAGGPGLGRRSTARKRALST